MRDLISVIIPVYNRQNVIEECIRSILEQSYQNFEIILIDDGSSDRTLDICRRIAGGDPRIVLLTMDHAGVSAARNRGLEKARGEYIFFIDSDDVIHPLLLQTLITGMQNSDAAISGTGVLSIPEKNWNVYKEKIAQDVGSGKVTYQDHQQILQAFFRETTPINLIGGVMMRRDLVGNTRFRTDIYIGEDFLFIYENLIKGAAAVFLEQKWYYARMHAHNSSWDYSYNGFWTRFYRRKLVWQSEERYGRTENADCQKRDAFGSFQLCMRRNKPYSPDGKRIRRVMKEHRKELLPAMSRRGKIVFVAAVYFPVFYGMLVRLKSKLRRI